MERAMEQLNVQLSRLTRSLRRARTVELPEGNRIEPFRGHMTDSHAVVSFSWSSLSHHTVLDSHVTLGHSSCMLALSLSFAYVYCSIQRQAASYMN